MESLEMSKKEHQRLDVLKRLHAGNLTQQMAAIELHLTAHQVRRLQRAYATKGARALAACRTEHNFASESNHRRERGRKCGPKVRDALSFERIGNDFGGQPAPWRRSALLFVIVATHRLRHVVREHGRRRPRRLRPDLVLHRLLRAPNRRT